MYSAKELPPIQCQRWLVLNTALLSERGDIQMQTGNLFSCYRSATRLLTNTLRGIEIII